MRDYCETYDAYYDVSGAWLEKQCSDPNCEYCAPRPETHLESCDCDKDYRDRYRNYFTED